MGSGPRDGRKELFKKYGLAHFKPTDQESPDYLVPGGVSGTFPTPESLEQDFYDAVRSSSPEHVKKAIGRMRQFGHGNILAKSLMDAAGSGNIQIIDVLAENGADLTQRRADGANAFAIALLEKQPAAAEHLLDLAEKDGCVYAGGLVLTRVVLQVDGKPVKKNALELAKENGFEGLAVRIEMHLDNVASRLYDELLEKKGRSKLLKRINGERSRIGHANMYHVFREALMMAMERESTDVLRELDKIINYCDMKKLAVEQLKLHGASEERITDVRENLTKKGVLQELVKLIRETRESRRKTSLLGRILGRNQGTGNGTEKTKATG